MTDSTAKERAVEIVNSDLASGKIRQRPVEDYPHLAKQADRFFAAIRQVESEYPMAFGEIFIIDSSQEPCFSKLDSIVNGGMGVFKDGEIAATSRYLESLSDEELLAVVRHEQAHLIFKDIEVTEKTLKTVEMLNALSALCYSYVNNPEQCESAICEQFPDMDQGKDFFKQTNRLCKQSLEAMRCIDEKFTNPRELADYFMAYPQNASALQAKLVEEFPSVTELSDTIDKLKALVPVAGDRHDKAVTATSNASSGNVTEAQSHAVTDMFASISVLGAIEEFVDTNSMWNLANEFRADMHGSKRGESAKGMQGALQPERIGLTPHNPAADIHDASSKTHLPPLSTIKIDWDSLKVPARETRDIGRVKVPLPPTASTHPDSSDRIERLEQLRRYQEWKSAWKKDRGPSR